MRSHCLNGDGSRGLLHGSGEEGNAGNGAGDGTDEPSVDGGSSGLLGHELVGSGRVGGVVVVGAVS